MDLGERSTAHLFNPHPKGLGDKTSPHRLFAVECCTPEYSNTFYSMDASAVSPVQDGQMGWLT